MIRFALPILAASALAAGIVVRERDPALALEVTDFTASFNPDGDGRRDVAKLVIFTRETEPAATVSIVGRDLAPIRRLEDGVRLEAGEPLALSWDGRTDSGERAPPGYYRLRVLLPETDRDVVFPRRIELLAREPGEPAERDGAEAG